MIKDKVCHYLHDNMEGEGTMKKVTNSNIGGRGSEMWHFRDDIIFEWSLTKFSLHTCKQLSEFDSKTLSKTNVFSKKRSKNIISTLFSLSKFNSHAHPGLVPTNIYMVKVNNRNTRKTGEICSKLTIISSYGRHWTYAINSKDISYHFLVFLLLNLNR